MEVLRGLRSDREWKALRELLAPLPVVTTGGEASALAAAALYRDLRKAGVTVRSSIDLLVGTWCIANACLLIHDDHDFDAMAARHGLITWKTP
jgi:predicted nucleic acid-binding protein